MANLKDLIVNGDSRFIGKVHAPEVIENGTTLANKYAPKTHTHNYAGSSSAGGAATSAVKATQDSAGQQINTTYIKNAAVNGKTITFTKGDGTTFTITTQDTNTTYGAAGTNLGLIKAGGDLNIADGVATVKDDSHNHVIGNVDGLQTALNGKLATSLKGAANGVAELDANGKVPTSQLPSYVDDVIEGYLSGGKFYKESGHTTQITGETGKIYIDLHTSKTYRWSGSAFAVISETLALGETSSTAYRGDRGKVAYNHSQSTHARTDATAVADSSTNGNIKINGTETNVYTHPAHTAKSAGLYKVTVDAQGHVSAATAVAKADITALGIPGTNTTYSNMGAATASAAGTAGLVPAPAAGKQTSFLRGDGTWVVPTNTTYSDMKGATTSANGTHGLVPAPAKGNANRYLRSDGTWQVPPDTNTTYADATTSTHGLMSAADKTKLNGLKKYTKWGDFKS